MNGTQTLWKIPKGKFDSAMLKLAEQIGDGFGNIVEVINTDKYKCKLAAEKLANPDVAFVRQLVGHVCYKFPLLYDFKRDKVPVLEALEEEFAWNSSEHNHFNDKVVRRALSLTEVEHPGVWKTSFSSRHWKSFSKFVLRVISKPGTICTGMLVIRSLVFELGLQRLARKYCDTYQLEIHRCDEWKLRGQDVPQDNWEENLTRYFRHAPLEKLLREANEVIAHIPPKEHVFHSLMVCG